MAKKQTTRIYICVVLVHCDELLLVCVCAFLNSLVYPFKVNTLFHSSVVERPPPKQKKVDWNPSSNVSWNILASPKKSQAISFS